MTMDSPPAPPSHTEVKNYCGLSLDSLTSLTDLHALNSKKRVSAFTIMGPISNSDITLPSSR
jgi:hypothetical protein